MFSHPICCERISLCCKIPSPFTDDDLEDLAKIRKKNPFLFTKIDIYVVKISEVLVQKIKATNVNLTPRKCYLAYLANSTSPHT